MFFTLCHVIHAAGLTSCILFDKIPNNKLLAFPAVIFILLSLYNDKNYAFSKCLALFFCSQYFLKTAEMIRDKEFYLSNGLFVRLANIFLTQWPLKLRKIGTPQLNVKLGLKLGIYVAVAFINLTAFNYSIVFYNIINKNNDYMNSNNNTHVFDENSKPHDNNHTSDTFDHSNQSESFLHPILAFQLIVLGNFVLFVLKWLPDFYRFLIALFLGWEFEPCFDNPEWSTSLVEYWGNKWNRPINYQLKFFIYKPLRQLKKTVFTKNNEKKEIHLVSGSTASLLTFAGSGLYHAYPVICGLWSIDVQTAFVNGVYMSMYFIFEGIGLHLQGLVYMHDKNHNNPRIMSPYLKWVSTFVLATLPGPFFLLPVKKLLQIEGDIEVPDQELLSGEFWKWWLVGIVFQVLIFSIVRYFMVVRGASDDVLVIDEKNKKKNTTTQTPKTPLQNVLEIEKKNLNEETKNPTNGGSSEKIKIE